MRFRQGTDLVEIGQAVDQAGVQRLGGQVGAAVDQAPGLIQADAAMIRDGLGQLIAPGNQKTVQIAANGRRHGVASQRIRRPLVFLALSEAAGDSQLGERFTQVGLLQQEAGEVQAAGGLQPDFVQRGCEVVVKGAVSGLAETLRESEGDLLFGPEGDQGVPKFLDLSDIQLSGA